jgi:nucleotide-binding universal stress UspA family protein
MNERPVIIGFDGTPPAVRAVHEAATVLAPRHAYVVVVWEAGRAFDLVDIPSKTLDMPTTALEIRTAAELDKAAAESARRLAARGAALATEAGLRAEGIAVADDITVADTLTRLAKEFDASVIVVGSHGHRCITELLVGSTTRDVLRHAPCSVLVARADGRVKHH